MNYKQRYYEANAYGRELIVKELIAKAKAAEKLYEVAGHKITCAYETSGYQSDCDCGMWEATRAYELAFDAASGASEKEDAP